MKIVFIGAGNLATNLALEISQSEHQIVQVFSRTRESASLLAEKVNCEPVNEMLGKPEVGSRRCDSS